MINNTYIDTTPNTRTGGHMEEGLQCRMLPDQWLMITTGLPTAVAGDVDVHLRGRVLTIASRRERDTEVRLGIDKVSTRIELHRRPRGRIQVIRNQRGVVHVLVPLGRDHKANDLLKTHATDGLGGIAAGRMVTARALVDRLSIDSHADDPSSSQGPDGLPRRCGRVSDS
jgi:hypothetical protein